jgi:hypothetical protein
MFDGVCELDINILTCPSPITKPETIIRSKVVLNHKLLFAVRISLASVSITKFPVLFIPVVPKSCVKEFKPVKTLSSANILRSPSPPPSLLTRPRIVCSLNVRPKSGQ